MSAFKLAGSACRRQGSILILVVGVASLLAVTATAVLLRVQADGRANRVVMQDAQCRLALTAALHFLLESSRIGWDEDGEHEAYGWVDIRDGQPGPRIAGQGPGEGPVAGSTWPALGSVYRGDMFAWQRPPYAMDPNPAPAAVPWLPGGMLFSETYEMTNDQSGDSSGNPHITGNWIPGLDNPDGRITEVRMRANDAQTLTREGPITVKLYAPTREPENKIGSVVFTPADLSESDYITQSVDFRFAGVDTLRFSVYYSDEDNHSISLQVAYQYILFSDEYDLFAPDSGPGEWQKGRERELNRVLMADFLEERDPNFDNRNWDWSGDSQALMRAIWDANIQVAWEDMGLTPHPHPDASTWEAFENGDRTPRGESLGRGWFRIYREPAADSLADDFLRGSTFIITVGAGGTRGYKDWAEANASGLFPSESVFNSLRRSERIQWWRARWVPQVGGGLDMTWQTWTSRVQRPGVLRSGSQAGPDGRWNYQRATSAADEAHGNRLARESHLTLMALNLDPSIQTSQVFPVVQHGGSIDWLYRLTEEPDAW